VTRATLGALAAAALAAERGAVETLDASCYTPLGVHARREVRCEHFDDHAPAERSLLGHEDARHPPAPELALERVTRAQRGLQLMAQVDRHGSLLLPCLPALRG
jgi:porphobilinogen deaminase